MDEEGRTPTESDVRSSNLAGTTPESSIPTGINNFSPANKPAVINNEANFGLPMLNSGLLKRAETSIVEQNTKLLNVKRDQYMNQLINQFHGNEDDLAEKELAASNRTISDGRQSQGLNGDRFQYDVRLFKRVKDEFGFTNMNSVLVSRKELWQEEEKHL